MVRGRLISTYDTDTELDTPPDLLLIAGPHASPKYSFRTRFYYSVKWQFSIADGKFIPATFF